MYIQVSRCICKPGSDWMKIQLILLDRQNNEHPLPSDWNDPHIYRAKTQSQASSRQPLPGWPKGVRKETLSRTENGPTPIENNSKTKETEVYYEPAERDSNGLVISGTNSISQEAFDNMD